MTKTSEVSTTEGGQTRDIAFRLHQTYDVLKDCEDKLFSKHGLTTEQYYVLLAVSHFNGSARVTDVASYLTRSPNSISMIAERMAKAGLILRVRDRRDRRAVYLLPTAKARELYALASVARRDFSEDILLYFSSPQLQALYGLLGALQSAVSSDE